MLSSSTSPNRSSLYGYAILPTVNVVIPNGLLLNLNYQLSMAGFARHAKTPINFSDKALMGKILQADQLLKMRGDVETFRRTMRELLNLNEIDDTTFDAIWCAMLGDLSTLKATYQSLKLQNKDKHIIFTSGTNPIHINALHTALCTESQQKLSETNPLDLNGIDCYVSYLQKSFSEAENVELISMLKTITTDEDTIKELLPHLAPLREIHANNRLKNTTTVVVLELSSDLASKELKDVENKNDRVALARKLWAEKQGFIVAPFDRKLITAEMDAVKLITSTVNKSISQREAEVSRAVFA